MNAALEKLLDHPAPGVAAWSARFADRTLVSHCYTDWFKPKQVEQALTRLTLAVENLVVHGIRPTRLCWVFEHARIHMALRSEGAYLALFVENRTGLAVTAIEEILAGFSSLPEL